jgi:hypothetical protein
MSAQQVEVMGTVRADGVLELDGPVVMEPGRVKVIVQAKRPERPEPPKDDPFWQMMHSIWDGQKARGHVPRSAEEIDAELREAREGWDERQRGIERLLEQAE